MKSKHISVLLFALVASMGFSTSPLPGGQEHGTGKDRHTSADELSLRDK
jgi:hypothetical protein